MQEERTRSDKIYEELNKFLDNDKEQTKSMFLYKREVTKLERHIYERVLPVRISSKKNVSFGKINITLEKM